MKKNIVTRVLTLVMAAVMAVTPITANAAEKRVITRDEFWDTEYSFFDEDTRTHDNKGFMKWVDGINGAYQKNGAKIYTVLNGSKKTFKKTGTYSIIVGGKNKDLDEGTVKFVAPKTGKYKVTMNAASNVAGGQLYMPSVGKHDVLFKTSYDKGNGNGKKSTVVITSDSDACAFPPKHGDAFDHNGSSIVSSMTKVTGTVTLKKGQSFEYTARSSNARYDEKSHQAYNFVGFDMTVKFIK